MNQTKKLATLETLRAYCIQCLGMKQFNTDQIRGCQGDPVGHRKDKKLDFPPKKRILKVLKIQIREALRYGFCCLYHKL